MHLTHIVSNYFFYGTGVLFWGFLIYVLGKTVLIGAARAVSLTRWMWRCSIDLKPRWWMLPEAVWTHFWDLVGESPSLYSSGSSYWRGVGKWKIEPDKSNSSEGTSCPTSSRP